MARTKKNTAATAVETVKASTVKEAATSAVEEVKTEAPKKTAARKTAAKSTAKKIETVENIYIQQNGTEVTTNALVEKAKADSDIKSAKVVDIYIRPEINMVYYVIDGEKFGSFELC